MPEYVLGANEKEFSRLRLQQEVWGGFTTQFLNRLGLRKGWRCLDVGCGPGFVLETLRERVGDSGEIVALDESPVWMEHLKRWTTEKGWKNVKLLQTKAEEADLPADHFDLIFMRWVLSFPPDPGNIVRKLARCLRPGGVLAVQDYNHEGISLFPESQGFRAVVQGTRRLYQSGGGDAWIAAKLPKFFREAGLGLVELTPHGICGGPDSPAFVWADAFFPPFSEKMVQAGVMTEPDRQLFLKEWEEHRRNPDALFFSPYVVDAAARRPDSR